MAKTTVHLHPLSKLLAELSSKLIQQIITIGEERDTALFPLPMETEGGGACVVKATTPAPRYCWGVQCLHTGSVSPGNKKYEDLFRVRRL